MKEKFMLRETALLGSSLEHLRRSVALGGHLLSANVLCRAIKMSPKTYRKVISGVVVVRVITCEC